MRKEYDFSNEFKKKCKGGSGADLPFDIEEISITMAKYYELRKYILEKDARIRMFLVLMLKKITWYNELKNKYDIHPSHITEFLEELKDKSIIIFKPLVEVDEILFETVLSQTDNMFYSQRNTVKVYTLSEEGLQFAERLYKDLEGRIEEKQSLKLHLQEILSKTEAHRQKYTNILEKETNERERLIKMPDGSIYIKDTKKTKHLELETKKAFLELKEESKKLSEQENNQLIELKSGNLDLLRNNIKKVVDRRELKRQEKELEGISDKEEREAEKEYKEQVNNKMRELYDITPKTADGFPIYYYLSDKGKEDIGIDPHRKTIKDEGLDFLNSL